MCRLAQGLDQTLHDCNVRDRVSSFCRVIKKGLKPPFESSRSFPIRLWKQRSA
jgi:hypothetical protein